MSNRQFKSSLPHSLKWDKTNCTVLSDPSADIPFHILKKRYSIWYSILSLKSNGLKKMVYNLHKDDNRNMEVIIDSREIKLLEHLSFVKAQHMELADVCLKDQHSIILCERKTWSDLWASIRDGRFREQRARLLQWRSQQPSLHILYLVEGASSTLDTKSLETCKRTLHRLMIGYQIPVIFTGTLLDTVRWIQWVFELEDLNILFSYKLVTLNRTVSKIYNKESRKSRFRIPPLF